jgi:hypothetical protein
VASSVATGVDGSAAAEGTAEGGSGEARREGEDDEEIAKAKADRRGAKKWLSPEDDEDCKRGIPVFEPTMEVSSTSFPFLFAFASIIQGCCPITTSLDT